MALSLRVRPFLCAFLATFDAVSYPIRSFARHEHQALMQEGGDALLVGLNTLDQVLAEAGHGVGEDANAVEQVAD
jgi:hypothetical protein